MKWALNITKWAMVAGNFLLFRLSSLPLDWLDFRDIFNNVIDILFNNLDYLNCFSLS